MNTAVNFETAKLLKEKGFDVPSLSYWSGLNLYSYGIENWNDKTIGDTPMHKRNAGYYSAPTISEVIMWLYEKHEIWVYVERNNNGTFQWFFDYDGGMGDMGMLRFNSPTEGYERGIEWILKNKIK